MRFPAFLVLSAFLLLCACSGKDSASSDEGTQVPDCDAMPIYALDGLDCEQLAFAFEKTVLEAGSCQEDADCRSLHPECEHWSEVDCHYPVNACFTEALLQEYDAASEGCAELSGMTYLGCTCGPPPEVRCLEGSCATP